jgi:predicted  nucleic acid-binding Zn-ribbon protein
MFESKEYLKKIDYLESERTILWDRITKLEKKVKENVSFHESEARNASKKTSEFRNKAEDRRNEVEEIFKKTDSIYNSLQLRLKEVENISENIKLNQTEISETIESLKQSSNTLEEKITTFEDFFEEHPELEDEITTLMINYLTRKKMLQKFQ